jgi:hypothetical protein
MMGRIRTPRYAVYYRTTNATFTPAAWNSKVLGRPTDENLAKHIRSMIDSFKIGAPNEAVAIGLGFIPVPNAAEIRDQFNGNIVVAVWTAPMFMVI